MFIRKQRGDVYKKGLSWIFVMQSLFVVLEVLKFQIYKLGSTSFSILSHWLFESVVKG